MTKKELRKIYMEKRLNISSKEKLKLDDLLLIWFQRLYFENIRLVFTYWPKASSNEPNTFLFSGYLRHMIPSLQIAYPVCDTSTALMDAMIINEGTIYRDNAFGIKEPAAGEIAGPENIDLVLVPLVICDTEGFRVGYGRGFYDRYLPQCRSDVIKVGFSYFDPVEQIEDRDVFDVPLNFCVTPGHVYEF